MTPAEKLWNFIVGLVKKLWRFMLKPPSGPKFGLLFGIVLIYLCIALKPPTAQNILVTVVGVLCGWPVGVYFSPFDNEDAKRLRAIGKAAAAFVSGYLLSTIEPVIQAKVQAINAHHANIPWLQLGLFISGFLLSAVLIFEGRSYDLAKKLSAKKNDSLGNKAERG